MPNFCGYVRVSDDKLKDDGSRRQDIDRQKKLLEPRVREFQESHPDWKFEGWFSDDAKSAWTDDLNARPEFARMMNMVKANRMQQIFLEELTRFSRNLGQGMIWLSDCGKKNCNVTSIHHGEHEITSLEGFTKNAVLLMLADIESRSRSLKVKSGMNDREDKESAKCGSCNVVHMGRHPQSCLCTVTKACRERRELNCALAKKEERGGQKYGFLDKGNPQTRIS